MVEVAKQLGASVHPMRQELLSKRRRQRIERRRQQFKGCRVNNMYFGRAVLNRSGTAGLVESASDLHIENSTMEVAAAVVIQKQFRYGGSGPGVPVAHARQWGL